MADIQGRELLLFREEDGRFQVIGEALEPVPVSAVWKARMGGYRILDPEGSVRQWAESGSIRVLMRDGFLLAETEGPGGIEQVLVLEPVSETRAVVRGIGSNRGQVIRIEQGSGGEQVLYSGLRLQKI